MKRNRTNFIVLALIVFVIILCCYLTYIKELHGLLYQHVNTFDKDNLEKMGLLGDSAGLMNALFSGLAFGGVILTILWQIKNDEKNRITERKTQFENTFFNMTQTFEHLIDGLSVKVDKQSRVQNVVSTLLSSMGGNDSVDSANSGEVAQESIITGRAVFKYIYQERKINNEQLCESIKSGGISAYEETMDGTLDHYFRYLYRILKFIDGTNLIDEEQKYRYSSIFRAQLSSFELTLIYYNGLSRDGIEKLKPLLEKYSILKNLREENYEKVSFENASAVNTENGRIIYEDYTESVRMHKPTYAGNWISVVLNVILWSVIFVVMLSVIQQFLDDFLFKDIFSLTIFKDYAGSILFILLLIIAIQILKQYVVYKSYIIKKQGYESNWTELRYVLNQYYDVTDFEYVIPLLIGLLSQCNAHDWYGYGFINYPLIIILWLSSKPLLSLGFAIHQTFIKNDNL